MSRYECLSCKGVYSSTNPDNSEYFHQCPNVTEDPRNENVKQEYLTKEAPAGTDKEISKGKGREKTYKPFEYREPTTNRNSRINALIRMTTNKWIKETGAFDLF